MSEADVPLERMQDYWALSTTLVALVLDIEQFATEHPAADADDPGVYALRHRLRDIVSRLADLTATE